MKMDYNMIIYRKINTKNKKIKKIEIDKNFKIEK